MLRETKTFKENDLTKNKSTIFVPKVNVSSTSLTSLIPKYTALTRSDFSMSIIENWNEIIAYNQPKRRSFHSSFIYKDFFYVYGGLDIITGKLNDISRLNLLDSEPKWENLNPSGVTPGKNINLKIRIFSISSRM